MPSIAPLLAAVLLCAGCYPFAYEPEQAQLFEQIRQAVERDPSCVNLPFQEGQTPLHLAIANGNRSLVEWLIERGADPNVRNERGQPAIFGALTATYDYGRPILTILIEHGADVNATAADGSTPLHAASRSTSREPLALLLEAGAKVDGHDEQGYTPLHAIANSQAYQKAEDVVHTIRTLADHGANPNARAKLGDTPLCLAATTNNLLTTNTLLSVGAKPDEPCKGGSAALHMAASFGCAEAAGALIQAGTTVDLLDDYGRSPLWVALNAPAVTAGPTGKLMHVENKALIDVLRAAGAHAIGPEPASE